MPDFKYKRDPHSLTGGYAVSVDGKPIGVVDRWQGSWAANCQPDGCWCHGFYSSREAAAHALLMAGLEPRR